MTDAGGRVLFTSKFRLLLQTATMCFSFLARFLDLSFGCFDGFSWTSPFDVDIVKFGAVFADRAGRVFASMLVSRGPGESVGRDGSEG